MGHPVCVMFLSRVRGGGGDVRQVHGPRVAAPGHLHPPRVSLLRGQGRPGDNKTKLVF